jgi:hypothetical protein
MTVIAEHVYVTGDKLVGSSRIIQPDLLAWCNRVELNLILNDVFAYVVPDKNL